MTPFSAPVEDILHSLEIAMQGHEIAEWDWDLGSDIIEHFGSFAEGVLAPINAIGDKQGVKLNAGRIMMPKGFKEAYDAYAQDGWPSLTIPEEFDGQGMSGITLSAVSEIFSGANHSLQMVTGLVAGAARTLLDFGTDAQKSHWLPRLASGEYISTMCLTEPGAGSDLSRVNTVATKTNDSWTITGEKIFISGGDQDITDGIFHLVLARTGDKSSGVKGLSLFICETRQDSDTQGLTVTRIEEKMGLHASPTCQIAFDNVPAELIGNEGEGLKAMFTMMNHARIDVSLQGVAHATRAHHIARSYAQERIQGRNAEGKPTEIINHAPVKQMIDRQRALSLGARLMTHDAMIAIETGNRPLADFLTPICKVFCTEAGLESANMGIQVLGGYGYLTEYGVDQTWRDARISAIYEGTNEIHAVGLVGRSLKLANGALVDSFVSYIQPHVSADLLDAWQKRARHIASTADPTPMAVPFMKATGIMMWTGALHRLATSPKTDAAEKVVLEKQTRIAKHDALHALSMVEIHGA